MAAIPFPGNPYREQLTAGAARIAPKEDQCEQILQAIFASAEWSGGTATYQEGLATANRLANLNFNQQIRRGILSGAGAAVIAAGLFMMMTMPTAMPNNTVHIQEIPPPLSSSEEIFLEKGYQISAFEPVGEAEVTAAPVFDGYSVGGQCISLYFHPQEDGSLPWQAIYARMNGLDIHPVAIDPDLCMVQFRLPDDRMEVFLQTWDGVLYKAELTVESLT